MAYITVENFPQRLLNYLIIIFVDFLVSKFISLNLCLFALANDLFSLEQRGVAANSQRVSIRNS